MNLIVQNTWYYWSIWPDLALSMLRKLCYTISVELYIFLYYSGMSELTWIHDIAAMQLTTCHFCALLKYTVDWWKKKTFKIILSCHDNKSHESPRYQRSLWANICYDRYVWFTQRWKKIIYYICVHISLFIFKYIINFYWFYDTLSRVRYQRLFS